MTGCKSLGAKCIEYWPLAFVIRAHIGSQEFKDLTFKHSGSDMLLQLLKGIREASYDAAASLDVFWNDKPVDLRDPNKVRSLLSAVAISVTLSTTHGHLHSMYIYDITRVIDRDSSDLSHLYTYVYT